MGQQHLDTSQQRIKGQLISSNIRADIYSCNPLETAR